MHAAANAAGGWTRRRRNWSRRPSRSARTATAASPRMLVAPSAPAPPNRASGRGHCGMPPPPDDEQLRTMPAEPSTPTTTRDCAVWLSVGPPRRRPTGTVAAGCRHDPPAVDRRQGRRSPPTLPTSPVPHPTTGPCGPLGTTFRRPIPSGGGAHSRRTMTIATALGAEPIGAPHRPTGACRRGSTALGGRSSTWPSSAKNSPRSAPRR
jgi:hypothetical protein